MIFSERPPLETTNYNIVAAVLGGFLSVFGLVSYLCKEKFYLSEARRFPDSPQGHPIC